MRLTGAESTEAIYVVWGNTVHMIRTAVHGTRNFEPKVSDGSSTMTQRRLTHRFNDSQTEVMPGL